MHAVGFGITDRLSSFFAPEAAAARPKPRNQVSDICLTIICGVGLLFASIAMTGGPLLFLAVVLIGATLLAVLQSTQPVVRRRWSPMDWMRPPPVVHHWASPPSRPYWHHVYTPPPPYEGRGWLRDGERHSHKLPTQA